MARILFLTTKEHVVNKENVDKDAIDALEIAGHKVTVQQVQGVSDIMGSYDTMKDNYDCVVMASAHRLCDPDTGERLMEHTNTNGIMAIQVAQRTKLPVIVLHSNSNSAQTGLFGVHYVSRENHVRSELPRRIREVCAQAASAGRHYAG